MSKQNKYFSFLYRNKTEKKIQSAIKKCKFNFDSASSEYMNKTLKNYGKVYILIANNENRLVKSIIKVKEFKHNTLKFEKKTRVEVSLTELEDSKEFQPTIISLFEQKENSVFLTQYEGFLSDLSAEEEETFELIRTFMKTKYKNQKKQLETESSSENNENLHKSIDTTSSNENNKKSENSEVDNPFLYHLIPYTHMIGLNR